jgi:Tol biopolymer transport system component/C-terminal processing protease CtpA/Prc
MKIRYFTLLIIGLTFISSQSQQTPLWMRYPAISPDGKTIVFSYQGDLFTVPTQGGKAIPLTVNEAHDKNPVWSHDGKSIAFASNRQGNFDVYLMKAGGGKATQLTFHSSNDFPSDFSVDNQSVIFNSMRLDDVQNQMFPSWTLSELYQVSVNGGRVKQILTSPAEEAKYNSSGNLLIYQDKKGYEDPFRKHHTSSVTRDIWTYNIDSKTYAKQTSFKGEDRSPIFHSDEKAFYYLSEKDGSFNVYRKNIGLNENATKLSDFKKHPVRHLTASDDNVLCFSYHGEIYTLKEGGTPKKVAISILYDDRYNAEKVVRIRGNVNQMAVSPNGKEIAFIVRGEVFVSSVKKGTTKRITNTPEQERSVDFSADGRSLVYAGERNGSWNLYQTCIKRKEEKYFFNSTLLEEEVILKTENETFQPSYSPDGKEVAFLENRTGLKVINLKSKEVREIVPANKNYSYADGDQHYMWSPGGKWFLVNFLQNRQWISQAGLVSAKGGEITDLTKSGYGHGSPKWVQEGKMMLSFSSRDGMKNHASWGGQRDVYGTFLTQEAYDNYRLNEEDYELMQEAEKEEKEEEDDDEKKDKKKKKEDSDKVKSLEFDLEDIADRRVRLTIHSSSLSDAYVDKKGEKLFYLARFEKGYNLWQTNLRTRETKILSKLGSSSGGAIIPDKEDKNLFIVAGGSVYKVDMGSGEKKNLSVKGEMILNENLERAYLFEHAWRQAKAKFYRKDLHLVDWDFYKKEYASFLPHINNNHDFAEMLSELLGELNASHTGARYSSYSSTGASTASLGLFYDETYIGTGLKILEVMDKSPVLKKSSKIKAGIIIEKIDGEAVEANTNYFPLLNRKAGKNVLLSLFDPKKDKRWEERVKPISFGRVYQLTYERWVKNCERIVDELSGGTIGYVHVRGMDDRSYRTVYENVLGKHNRKKALIVDTRFNGGGWLHDDLATFLDGEKYLTFMPRGQDLGDEPQFKWKKPSVVVMSEGNYSDAHMFPFTYNALGIGKLIGMPVPGTGTAVWWESLQNGVVFGIPQVGMLTLDGGYLENTQLEPDIKVANEPGVVTTGRDQQLEAAVNELKKQIKTP